MKKNETVVFPTLPLDSERVRQIRSRCQKPREQEEIWSWFVLRRISIYVTLVLLKIAVKPNTVSWISVILFLAAGGCMLAAEPWAYVLAVVCYNLAYLCDCVDGELARLTGVTSRKGFFIDTLIRATSIPLIVSFALSLATGSAALSVAAARFVYVVAVVATFALLVPFAYHLTDGNRKGTDPVGAMRTASRRNEWIAFWTGLPGFFAALLPVLLFEKITGTPTVSFYGIIFLSVFLLKTVLRLYITYKNVK